MRAAGDRRKVIDSVFIIAYLVMMRQSPTAFAPAIAFLLTSLIAYIDVSMILQHSIFIIIYTVCALFASAKIAYIMLVSTIINYITVVYFLFNLHIQNYENYFLTCMIIVNIIILYSIIKGVKNGSDNIVDSSVFSRVFNLLNLQAHTKTGQR